jgi:cytidylate kinase
VGSVTLSASYGAGGSVVGPAVAERLNLPFLDRAIPAAVARRLALTSDDADGLDERAPTGLDRLAGAFAHLSSPVGPSPLLADPPADPERFRDATEAVLRSAADTTGAVILGRAGMVVLAHRPDVLCVRLDAPAETRLARVVELEGIDEDDARKEMKESDAARQAYVRVFYRARQDDPALYHVILDTAAVDLASCVEIVVTAARARFAAP